MLRLFGEIMDFFDLHLFIFYLDLVFVFFSSLVLLDKLFEVGCLGLASRAIQGS